MEKLRVFFGSDRERERELIYHSDFQRQIISICGALKGENERDSGSKLYLKIYYTQRKREGSPALRAVNP